MHRHQWANKIPRFYKLQIGERLPLENLKKTQKAYLKNCLTKSIQMNYNYFDKEELSFTLLNILNENVL